MKEVTLLSPENFNKEVIQSKEAVLVFYWADWCKPCKSMIPVFDSFSNKFINLMKISKINVGNMANIPEHLTVKCTPTIAIFKNGKKLDQVSGFASQEEIESIIIKNKILMKNEVQKQ